MKHLNKERFEIAVFVLKSSSGFLRFKFDSVQGIFDASIKREEDGLISVFSSKDHSPVEKYLNFEVFEQSYKDHFQGKKPSAISKELAQIVFPMVKDALEAGFDLTLQIPFRKGGDFQIEGGFEVKLMIGVGLFIQARGALGMLRKGPAEQFANLESFAEKYGVTR